MLETPKIIKTRHQLIAFIHVAVPRLEIKMIMRRGIAELVSAVSAQGITPVGPLFSHHLKMDPGMFDLRICVPVSAQVKPVGRVNAGELAAANVARTTYRGAYEGLGPAWGEFKKWVVAQGLRPREDLWECYISGPESDHNPANWCTELNQPLVE